MGLSEDCKTFLTARGHVFLLFEDIRNGNGVNGNDCVTLSMSTQTISSFAMNKDGSSFVSGDDVGNVVLWKKVDGKSWEASHIATHEKEVITVSIDRSSLKVASASIDGPAIIWKHHGCTWAPFKLHGGENVRHCTLSRRGTFLVTWSSDRKLRLWRDGGRDWKGRTLDGTFGDVYAIEISDDNNLIVCGSAWNVVVFERHGEQWTHKIIQGHTRPVTGVAIREANHQVVSASRYDGTVRVSDVQTANWKLTTIEGHEYGVRQGLSK